MTEMNSNSDSALRFPLHHSGPCGVKSVLVEEGTGRSKLHTRLEYQSNKVTTPAPEASASGKEVSCVCQFSLRGREEAIRTLILCTLSCTIKHGKRENEFVKLMAYFLLPT